MSDITQTGQYRPDPPQKSPSGGKKWLFLLIGVLVLAAVAVTVLLLIPKDETPDERPRKEKIAALIGDHELSIAEANYFYIDHIQNAYQNWYSMYGENTGAYSLLILGLDLAKPLGEQRHPEKDVTWAEFMINEAMRDAAATYALYDAARAEGFVLSEEALFAVKEDISEYEHRAQLLGYRDLRGYLQALYHSRASEESFEDYLILRATAKAYQSHKESSLQYDIEELRAYEADRYHRFSTFSYCQYFISTDLFLPDGTENRTPEEMQKAQESAQKLAGDLARSKADTQEALDAVISKKCPGPGSSDAYTDVPFEQVPATLADWLCYEDRHQGDTTLIAAPQDENGFCAGYYVVMFQSRNENTMPLVNVRHILFRIADGASASEKQSACDRATNVFDIYINGERTEASFAALAAEHSDDTASIASGGLYTEIYPGQMVPGFSEWCFDEQRAAGDVGIVETEYGYHILYFCGPCDRTYRDYLIAQQMRSLDYLAWYESILTGTCVSNVDYDYFHTGYILAP